MKTTNDFGEPLTSRISITQLLKLRLREHIRRGDGKIRRPDGHEKGCKIASYGYDRIVELMTYQQLWLPIQGHTSKQSSMDGRTHPISGAIGSQ